jgi:2-keto-4-pentenoate hydratase/2-oxohepta-3-ene-1,7-dioic acid hydratase in catechol pathway
MVGGGLLTAVGFGLDLTKRQIQSSLKASGLPWERSKAFDGSAVFSNFVKLDTDMSELTLELHINEHLVQEGGYDLMINKPAEILSEVKSFLSLEDGDLIMTGTPKGVGRISPGDRLCGKIFANENLLVEADWTVK